MTNDDQIDLSALIEELMTDLDDHTSGRTARTVVHGDRLRGVVMALDTGRELSDHTAPGPAVLQVLRGDLEFRWEGRAARLSTGTLFPIPDAVHSVHALTPCAFMLTIALPTK
ncbi:cupin domain-containing protein [Nocardioides alcanivorans]|uniref:cupin domain-containing protein n=1 Tax=Nocardioides alcanivorans TaxID=2897352 RepID=UPI001F2A67BB|nr:cupin domain-containing protein [Nocardioides alcanivorans]